MEFLSTLDTSVALYRSRTGGIPEEEDEVSAGGDQSPTGQPPTAVSSLSSIGPSVRSQVDDCLWVDDLRAQYAELESKRLAAGQNNDRCVVCTLPYGTCKHTQTWMVDRIDDTKDVVDREVEELMAFVGGSVEVDTAPAEEDVDLNAIRWVHLEPAMSDKIGTSYFSVYNPKPRGWHSCVHLGHYVLVFGGFRYKSDSVPQPFGPATVKEDVEYLSDLAIFDTVGRSWHASPKRDCSPGGRYGHIAAPLDDDRMLVYGGRTGAGRFLSDTWIYSLLEDSWTPLKPDSASPPPSPRVFSSACVHEGKVYLFGGTDGVDNFGDLWVFHGDTMHMRWERTVAVGIPPSPRYGHKIIVIRESRSADDVYANSQSHMTRAAHGRLAVVGGCTVSPQSEVVGTAMTSAETKMMLDLGSGLQNNYLAEGLTAHLGGSHLASSADMAGEAAGAGSLKALYRTAASVTGHLHELEAQTREAEKNLVTQFHVMQASRNLKLQKAKHPDPLLDVIFLDVRDLTWKPQIYPPITGDVPSSRMHFGCVSLGGNVIVLGGTKPTSLAHSPSEPQYTRILSLDLSTFRWTTRHPVGSVESLEVPLQIADSDIMRARQRVSTERDRGKALGARNGMTVELAEAQVVLDVCTWRRKMLERERENLREPPPPRWGASLDAVGCRAFYLGGWEADALVPKGETYILDLEHEMERRRREMDEFHLKLERDRKNMENNSNLRDMQSAYELRAMLLAEKANESKERARMGLQDLLSRIPPLSVPVPPRLTKVNEHSMWLQWDRLYQSVTAHPVDPASVTYNLYMINGYQNLTVEARVVVLPLGAPGSMDEEEELAIFGTSSAASVGGDDVSVLSEVSAPGKRLGKGPRSVGSKTEGSAASASGTKASTAKIKFRENVYKDYEGPGFPGEITGISATDRFSVSFDDGTFEGNIHRRRIKLERKIMPDRLIRYNEDGTVALPPMPPGLLKDEGEDGPHAEVKGGNNDDDDDDEEDVKKKAAKKRKEAAANKYGHLLTELNRESLTIRPEMSWATQKRIMSKLKMREAAVQRIMKMHPSYKRSTSSSSSVQSGGSATGLAGTTPASAAAAAAAAALAGASSDESEEESDDEEGERKNMVATLADGTIAETLSRLSKMRLHKRSSAAHQPTVSVPPEYSLLYSGNACAYELTGIVPLEVLTRDPKLTVPVTFVLQTAGTDFPSFEFSQLSHPIVYYTRTMPSKEELLRGIDSLDGDADADAGDGVGGGVAAGAGAGPGADAPRSPNEQTTDSLAAAKKPVASVSRTKKQLITAIVEGSKIVQLEKQGHIIQGAGDGDYYL